MSRTKKKSINNKTELYIEKASDLKTSRNFINACSLDLCTDTGLHTTGKVKQFLKIVFRNVQLH